MLTTELSRRLGLTKPIIGAPMAGASHGALARAVSAAGGLGMVGVGGGVDADFVRHEAAIASDGGRLPFGIGLQLWAVDRQPAVVEAVAEQRPTVVSLSFGDAGRFRDTFADCLIAAQVNSVEDAKSAVDQGVDIVVAQGTDAGGHTGYVGTLPLLQAVLEHVDKPVVAAGGIGTGRGLAAVLAAGAQAGWIGTRLLACTEAAGTAAAKKRVIDAEETGTVLTRVFDLAMGLDWPDRYPGRALRNDLSDRWHGREDELVEQRAEVGTQLRRALEAEEYDTAVIYAGQAAALVHDERPAADVLEELAAEAERCLRKAAALYAK